MSEIDSIEPQPPYLFPPYKATLKRAPTQPLIIVPARLCETSGPLFGHHSVTASDADLTSHGHAPPLGEQIIVSGIVRDEDAKPIRGALIEIWQANAAGRYRHKADRHGAPLDPNFTGCGRDITDDHGRYRFTTIRPGAYPWANSDNAWRPAHIHFSLFGAGLISRLVTQMYFPGDPLLPFDPIFQSVPGERARNRLVSCFDWDTTVAGHALGFRFDIVLRGRTATPTER